MVKLADTLVLEASAARRRGSSPLLGTILSATDHVPNGLTEGALGTFGAGHVTTLNDVS